MLICDNAGEEPAMAIPLCDAVSWAQEKHGASFEEAAFDHDVTPGEGGAWLINSKGAYSYTLAEEKQKPVRVPGCCCHCSISEHLVQWSWRGH